VKYKICGWTMFHCWIYHSLSIAPKENFEKILKKFHKNSKKSKSFFSNPEKVWNSLKHDEYFIHFRLVGLRLDPQKIRKVQFFKKKMLSYFWTFKIDAEKLHFSIFLPSHFRKIAKKIKISEWDIYQKNKNFEKIILTFSDFLGIKSETNH